MIHVVPTADTLPHEETTACPCLPTVDTTGSEILVIHNAFDGREGVEIAKEIISRLPPPISTRNT